MRAKLIHWILLFLFVSISINLYRTVREFARRGDVMRVTEKRLNDVAKENEQLSRKYAQVQTQAYIEAQARERFSSSREGETVVLMPSIHPALHVTPTPIDHRPNWDKWLSVFN